MFILKTFSFYLSLFGIFIAILFANIMSSAQMTNQYVQEPPVPPYENYIAASGIVEARNENTDVGVPIPGVVQKIWFNIGSEVKQGEPLFQIDSTDLEGRMAVLKANLQLEAKNTEVANDMFDRVKMSSDYRAISRDELEQRKSNAELAAAKLLVVEKQIGELEQQINQRIVKAPIDGVILQQNIRVGEYVSNGRVPIVIGNIETLQIRTDIDEFNVTHFSPDSPALAYPKNDSTFSIPLTFVRIEPYVKPKKNLTGVATERVDTRVLQVIYSFEPPKEHNIYVGLQVDVYIEVPNSTKGEAGES